MTFHQFVINNVVRNKRIYGAYFLSSMFTVMIFFTFAMFAFHPALSLGKVNDYALFGMSVAGGIIYIFSFFFVLYSMGSFLQTRKKEFGLLSLHGMTTHQIRLMVFLENMLIGTLATAIGILTGLVFSKLILMIAEKVLVIEETLYFYIPIWAIVLTFVSFLFLFLVISFAITFVLRTKKLIELIKADQQPKKEPKASIWLAILALVLLSIGYSTALIARGLEVLVVMIPVIVVVMIGTYFLFTQLSVYLIHFIKKRKLIFWKKTNMILYSDLSFRMKDNARTFFMVAMISTVSFSAIGTLFGLQSYLINRARDINPYSFTYIESKHQTAEDLEHDLKMIDQMLEERGISASKASAEFGYYEIENNQSVLITNQSTYNQFAQVLGAEKVDLEANQVIGVRQSEAIIGDYSDEQINTTLKQLEMGENLDLVDVIDHYVITEMEIHFIVSDQDYENLPQPLEVYSHNVWSAEKADQKSLVEVGEELTETLNYTYAFQAFDYMFYMINKAYGPILFIGLFIGIVFFVSAGSFLYFRLFTDLDQDRVKFASIAKIGLSEKELNKVISCQTCILFFAPIIVALVHGAVALTALSHFFNYDLTIVASSVLGSFFVIQFVYYLIVRYLYLKQIKRAILI